MCAARLFLTASQSIAKGDEDIGFKDALLAQMKPLTEIYPVEILFK